MTYNELLNMESVLFKHLMRPGMAGLPVAPHARLRVSTYNSSHSGFRSDPLVDPVHRPAPSCSGVSRRARSGSHEASAKEKPCDDDGPPPDSR